MKQNSTKTNMNAESSKSYTSASIALIKESKYFKN